MGETVDLTVDIYPDKSVILDQQTTNTTNTTSQRTTTGGARGVSFMDQHLKKQFINVFNLKAVPSDQLEETCMQLWNQIFSTLHMKSYMSHTMPTHFTSSNGAHSSTSVIIKRMGSDKDSMNSRRFVGSSSSSSTPASSSLSSSASSTSLATSMDKSSSMNRSMSTSNLSSTNNPSTGNTGGGSGGGDRGDRGASSSSSASTSVEDDDIDFYIFKGVSITKQTMNSHAVSMKNVSTPKEGPFNGRSFHTQVHVDDARFFNMDIPLYLITELYISSEQFSDLVVKTLADTRMNQQASDGSTTADESNVASMMTGKNIADAASDMNLNRRKELDLLLAYETSRHYIKEKIFLCALCVPVTLINPMNITWSSQLLTNKAYVQLHVQNIHPHYEIVLKDSNMHLLASKVVRYLTPDDAVKQLSSNRDDDDQVQQPNISELSISKTSVQKQSEITELYETFVDKNIFPVTVKPGEQYSITFLVCPTDRSVRTSDKDDSVNDYSASKVTIKPLATARGTRKSAAIVQTNMLSEYATPITIDYSINGLSSDFKQNVMVRWVSVDLIGGIQTSIACPESVKLLQPFDVEILISNYTAADLDLTIESQLSTDSSLICQDGCVDIGIIKANDTGRFKLCFVAVQNGLQQLNQLRCINKKTSQEFVFLFPVYLMVTDDTQ